MEHATSILPENVPCDQQLTWQCVYVRACVCVCVCVCVCMCVCVCVCVGGGRLTDRCVYDEHAMTCHDPDVQLPCDSYYISDGCQKHKNCAWLEESERCISSTDAIDCKSLAVSECGAFQGCGIHDGGDGPLCGNVYDFVPLPYANHNIEHRPLFSNWRQKIWFEMCLSPSVPNGAGVSNPV